MSEKTKDVHGRDLPTSILAPLFAALMFTGFQNQFPLLTLYQFIITITTFEKNSGEAKPVEDLLRFLTLWWESDFKTDIFGISSRF